DVASFLDTSSSSSENRGRRSEVGQDLRTARLPAWKRLDSDVDGEWGFYLILDQFLKSPAESRRAAAGWGGDRFALYEGPRGEAMLVSLSVWDTENDAREFLDAYVKRTQLRYPDSTPSASTEPRAPGRDSCAFRTSEGLVTIDLIGSRVLIIEGAPDLRARGVLMNALGQ